jgi:GT2 family glycosyltransferase
MEHAAPEVSVVVPSHDRPARLARLLDALAGQSLERERWEVVVAHDSSGPETEELLRGHHLAKDGTLRQLSFPPGSGAAAAKRNAGWRASRGELVVFTDDDCRPPEEWLERLLVAYRAHPGAIVQGKTRPDPEESELLTTPWYHSQALDPPTAWAEMCNIAYPRALLDRLGGLAEELTTGEDTDLAWRGIELGAAYVGADDALTYHCVERVAWRKAVRGARRWHDLPEAPRRHPAMRRHLPLRVFSQPSHLLLVLALGGLALERRTPLALALSLPYVLYSMPGRGHDPRARFQALTELAAVATIDACELAVLARASVKHRSLLL